MLEQKNSKMTYKESLDYLYSLQVFGKKQGLLNINVLLRLLGNPHEKLKFIHITGTNGKGSTCGFIKSILMEAGLKVGLFTSPHLTSIRERIIINDEIIPKNEFIDLFNFIKPYIEETYVETSCYPIFFEVITSLALLYFEKKKTDIVVLEVGIGGKFDTTNVITPLISVITNVELDHTQKLGKTKEEITKEKGGIIKEQIPVVTQETDKKVIKILQNICKINKTNLLEINKICKFRIVEKESSKQTFILQENSHKRKFTITMLGRHQVINAITAIKTVELLPFSSFIDEHSIRNGLFKAKIFGRLEIVKQNPLIILDAAHNPAAFKILNKALYDYFKDYKKIFIFGILKDKNVVGILKEISKIADKVIISKPISPRATEPVDLATQLKKYFTKPIIIKEKIKDAIGYAEKIFSDKTLICITGSFYLIGKARRILVKDATTD